MWTRLPPARSFSPQWLVGRTPGVQLTWGPRAGVDVGENGPFLFDGNGNLDVEIADTAIA